MGRLIFVLGISIGSVFAGYVLKRVARGALRPIAVHAGEISRVLKLTSIFVLNPIPIVNSFWQLRLESGRLALFPLLGLFMLALGGIAAVLANRIFRIPPKRAASVFVASMFTNIVTFGGLTAFVFFGTDGYGFVQLFNMFVSVAYYAVGYPISEQLAKEDGSRFAFSPRIVLDRPYLLIPITAIAVGILLNLRGLERPTVIGHVSSLLIPLITGFLGLSIGLTLYFGRIADYVREIALISVIKFIIVPAVMIPVGLLLGFQNLAGGVAFRVLVIVSVMPVAFNALVPPVVYGFDLDLANSAWIVTTLGLLVILPLIYFTLVA
ncbi:MAG: AEC family transporter [Spirochaetota bacterium]